METERPHAQVFRFGAFEVDLRSGELRKRGIRLSLQEQPLRILAALLTHPGEIVTREELCARLWPHGTFVDFEHSLNAAVRRLRVTLGDAADTPRFIETVHRRGYRFLAWGNASYAHSVKPGVKPCARSRLAVLPFVSFGDEPRGSGFNDGLTEETIIQIARLCSAQVGVIARTSVMRRAGVGQSAAETGSALGADYLLEGSIRRECERVRIVAQLIESHEETHLWAATYDRMVTDALTVQMEVADAIARGVAAALSVLRPALSREAAS
jgi:TolB-like protein/DNA-binding winged helix-turn-helix (wHTH) protein